MNEKELRQKFVNKAIEYVGVAEGSSKHKYIIDTYNKIVPLPVNYKVKYTDAWCATFVSAIAKLCGLLDVVPAECSCNRQIALAKKMGIWVENDAYVPKTGDIILYDWDDNGIGNDTGSSEHVGIVVSVSGNTIKVIEGNYNDKVGYRNIAINGRYIRGFICPKFASKATDKEIVSSLSSKRSVCQVELGILKKGSKGQSVKALQAMLVGFGYSVGSSGIDGHFGSNTESAVKKYQKAKSIEIDGIVGQNTWMKLLK